ncbi:NACHT, LRR and PYD domains-containing protein 12-like isoform X2 [Polypterus senegalus]|uniref:NACHT, LRR and PYD domains-containing protein 12-like isoform X2 n=1 Tax=Polypterus senegalus TaxID=55291 RepID=UPI0019665E20|nr:NACHT, LRR and PYD domains-containing protein 12-like isoform X2 [Polypterus senegalus]
MVINKHNRAYNETHHEFLKIGRTHAKLLEEHTKMICEQIWAGQLFRRSPGSKIIPKIVVVSGVAGIGKTTMVQKIMFDWATGTHYQRFAFVFQFKFRELNLLGNEKEPQMSLTRMIVRHYKYLNDLRLGEILKKPESLLFIFDGLDEYKQKLDFTQRRLCSNFDDYFPVHILVSSLVKGTLLKGCSVLITTRPTALESLDLERVDQFAEILGFLPEQRLMYFRKFFGDNDLATEVFQFVQKNDILYTMCFNPSFCWIICSVLKNHFMTPAEERGTAPRTVTELFVMFLHNILTKHRQEVEDQQGILVKLGKMAYYGITNRILVFYDRSEMYTFGLQPILSSSSLPEFLKEILQRESILESTMYTFFHLTLQEFMAACSFFFDPSADVEELLVKMDSCENGRFEIFIHFLAGLTKPSVFKTMEDIIGEVESNTAVPFLKWVKQKAEQALRIGDKSEVLRVCQWLYESQNQKIIKGTFGKGLNMDFTKITLCPLDCAVLGSVISFCGELQNLDLSNTYLTPESTWRLTPGLSCSRNVVLNSCHFTSGCCGALSLVLSTKHSRLIHLELSDNNLEDSGVHLLCEGLRNANCKLETLELSSCGLTSKCCKALSSALSAEHSHLTGLRLDKNKLKDSGVHLLNEGLRNPNCRLKILGLDSCGLTSGNCEALALVLSSGCSQLTVLELGDNQLKDSGVRLLCEGLSIKNCKLERLRLKACGLTSGCCQALSFALSFEHSHLFDVWLNDNKLGDSGVRLLCEGLRSKNCKLETLRLSNCYLTSGCGVALSSALSSDHSHLTELWLGGNNLGDSGVRLLYDGLRNPNCKLQKLSLMSCGLTSGCCAALSTALSAQHSSLTSLELGDNKLKDSGVRLLCEGLRSRNCKLKGLDGGLCSHLWVLCSSLLSSGCSTLEAEGVGTGR